MLINHPTTPSKEPDDPLQTKHSSSTLKTVILAQEKPMILPSFISTPHGQGINHSHTCVKSTLMRPAGADNAVVSLCLFPASGSPGTRTANFFTDKGLNLRLALSVLLATNARTHPPQMLPSRGGVTEQKLQL